MFLIYLWLILSRLNIVKPSFHSVFAAPEYPCDIKKGEENFCVPWIKTCLLLLSLQDVW